MKFKKIIKIIKNYKNYIKNYIIFYIIKFYNINLFGKIKFLKIVRLQKKFFYWPPAVQLYGPPYIVIVGLPCIATILPSENPRIVKYLTSHKCAERSGATIRVTSGVLTSLSSEVFTILGFSDGRIDITAI
jgi:hypothetical protein